MGYENYCGETMTERYCGGCPQLQHECLMEIAHTKTKEGVVSLPESRVVEIVEKVIQDYCKREGGS